MRRIFGVLITLFAATTIQAQTTGNEVLAYHGHGASTVVSETGIEIYPTVVNKELNINVDEKLANGTVTISIFNAVGEIVLEETLGLGLNKLSVADLSKGEYTAVVRQNDVYKSKLNFEVI